MRHVKSTSKAMRPVRANDLEDFLDKVACEINPDKDKCEPEKEWPWD